MSENSKRILTIFEVIFVFVSGIFGNLLSGYLNISPFAILFFTALILLFLIYITLRKPNSLTGQPDSDGIRNKFRNKFTKWMPNSIIEIFPVGIVIAILMYSILSIIGNITFGLQFFGAYSYFNIFHNQLFQQLPLMVDEFILIFIGSLSLVIAVMYLDFAFSASFYLGYSLGIATSLVMMGHHLVKTTYVAHGYFVIVFIILICLIQNYIKRLKPVIKNLVAFISKERI